eukprot:1369316-Amphidinium_carterae.1
MLTTSTTTEARTEDVYPQQAPQLHQQALYLAIVHTTTRNLRDLTDYLRTAQNRQADWFLRRGGRDVDYQYPINGDRNARGTTKDIKIGEYMEPRVTYKQTKTNVITNKAEYKAQHYHDFSIIIPEKDLHDTLGYT